MRIQKYLAMCGVAARRKAEDMIRSGQIEVDGEVAIIGQTVDDKESVVKVNGVRVKPQRFEYYILNKPKGYLSTVSDDRGRKTVTELIKTRVRLFPVGRLDKNTQGLLILTNDGDLAHKVLHPSFETEKEYEVILSLPLDEKRRKKLIRGVPIDGRPVKIRFSSGGEKKFRIIIHEGRKHIVRRLFDRLGFDIISLKRIRVGSLTIKGLAIGEYRKLTPAEIAKLS